jgi:hypothetical protein
LSEEGLTSPRAVCGVRALGAGGLLQGRPPYHDHRDRSLPTSPDSAVGRQVKCRPWLEDSCSGAAAGRLYLDCTRAAQHQSEPFWSPADLEVNPAVLSSAVCV